MIFKKAVIDEKSCFRFGLNYLGLPRQSHMIAYS